MTSKVITTRKRLLGNGRDRPEGAEVDRGRQADATGVGGGGVGGVVVAGWQEGKAGVVEGVVEAALPKGFEAAGGQAGVAEAGKGG